MIVAPNILMNSNVAVIVPILITRVIKTVEALVCLVDLFSGGRRGEVAFKHVDAVKLEVITGSVAAERLKRGADFFINNHKKTSL